MHRHNYICIYLYSDISTLLCTYVLMVIPKSYPHSYLQSRFLWIVRYGVPSRLFTCKVMAAQTDTKDRARPLLG